MITDKRLKKLIDRFNRSEAYANEDTDDVVNSLQELLALRQECREWREDAERLAEELEKILHSEWDPAPRPMATMDIADKHNVLVEKYGKINETQED